MIESQNNPFLTMHASFQKCNKLPSNQKIPITQIADNYMVHLNVSLKTKPVLYTIKYY